VIEAKAIGFSYGDRTVISDLTTTLMRGDKVGIIGPNGAGKTTLIQLLLGQLTPTQGTVRQGTNLEVAYFDQLKARLDEDKTVQQNVSEYETIPINGVNRHVIGYLQDFLFPPERSRSLVKFLSGGERSRLLLAKLFTKPSNVMVLDEPTNDLDIETLELLGGLLVEYKGTVLLVSHDRAFLDDVVTSTLAIEPDGRVKEYDGGYEDFIRQQKAEGAAATALAAESKAAAADTKVANSAPAPTNDRARKLSFKERKELETLPAKIEKLEAALQDLHAAMADPAFYKKSGSSLAEAKAKLEAAEQELAQAYARWELLEASGG
jgi:ATP-binding cassette subfamily F protein uup